uniref:Uncharacterized protein n=1 Tax=Ascaris lumbricoides TaxID=6252 RepID=A0A0M3IAQ5_ASCLU
MLPSDGRTDTVNGQRIYREDKKQPREVRYASGRLLDDLMSWIVHIRFQRCCSVRAHFKCRLKTMKCTDAVVCINVNSQQLFAEKGVRSYFAGIKCSFEVEAEERNWMKQEGKSVHFSLLRVRIQIGHRSSKTQLAALSMFVTPTVVRMGIHFRSSESVAQNLSVAS